MMSLGRTCGIDVEQEENKQGEFYGRFSGASSLVFPNAFDEE